MVSLAVLRLSLEAGPVQPVHHRVDTTCVVVPVSDESRTPCLCGFNLASALLGVRVPYQLAYSNDVPQTNLSVHAK